MKKAGAWLLIAALLSVFVFQPAGKGGQVEAASLSQIEKDIAAANKQIKEAERTAANAAKQANTAEHEKQDLNVKKADLQQEITSLMKEIDKVAVEKQKTQEKVDAKEEELKQAGVELDEVQARIVKREALLEQRMRLMYTNGFVSYMDVLLSANSFSDFLDRFDALQTILNSDRDVLESHKKDKVLAEEKKADIEKQYAEIQALFHELELQQVDLAKKESEKEVLIASYNANLEKLDDTLEHLEEISEEQEKLLVALAAKKSKLVAEKNRIKNPYTGGKLGMPIDPSYRVTSNFGTRVHPITGRKHSHTGIDFGAPSGTPIYAAESGVVIISQVWSTYGNCIVIDHGNGLWTLYAHIRNGGLLVDEGDNVKKGQQIAEVGSTGNSTGPHLHFEVRKNEVPVNPGGYLK
ncbi:peptidoglycan DD-metalloendopeptidase family protein [Paenibacillus sp. LHD-117]|uniref:murein hydrolase activator EnvC family protein n=1 Tax=Paenibacillus sp. LHD-117 TaxID=3071412 RepID=UPI0027E0FABD|nr:peptidoglycan DD-metalloendopeptidase family protein [Paenibacillus sp. LHD-117]MDQ6422481.1 peptidoglycan DD-metalloendopeptidase family protein [Paenibacillus sp. LHD-117]